MNGVKRSVVVLVALAAVAGASVAQAAPREVGMGAQILSYFGFLFHLGPGPNPIRKI